MAMIPSPSRDPIATLPGLLPATSLPGPQALTFEGVYREYFRFVWRSARRMGVDDALLEDVVQDSFVIVHRRLGEFEARSSLKTWLYGIVRRVVADHRRTLRRKPAHHPSHVPEDPGAVADPASDGPDVCAEHAERIALVRRLLTELDEDKREVLMLAELEGMTMAEIGEAIDVNPNTVSSRLRAARRDFELALERWTAQERPIEVTPTDSRGL